MSRPKLPVIFRMSMGEVVAVFPTLPGTMSGTDMVSYVHVGQHGSASFGWYHSRKHRPATRAEYLPLLRELRGIYGRRMAPGDSVFTLAPVRKRTAAHRRAYYAAIRNNQE